MERSPPTPRKIYKFINAQISIIIDDYTDFAGQIEDYEHDYGPFRDNYKIYKFINSDYTSPHSGAF